MEPRARKYIKQNEFLSFARKNKKKLLDTASDSLKTTSKKIVHKAGKFLGNKITVAKSNDDKPNKNPRNVEEIRKKKWNIRQIKKSIIKMEHYEISKLLNDSTVLKFVSKNGLK